MVYYVNETNLKHNFVFPSQRKNKVNCPWSSSTDHLHSLFEWINALWILERINITEKWSSTRPRTFLSLFWQFKVKHLTWFDVSDKVVNIWKTWFAPTISSKKTLFYNLHFKISTTVFIFIFRIWSQNIEG